MERKVINDAVAYIRGLAELRGRNADWAEKAVRGAASLSSTAALQQKVIDVVARDIPDLLTQIDGREVKMGDHALKLATRDLGVQRVKPDWRTELLAVITNPTVAYGLMLIGIYGLLLEGYNPGVMLPGVAGTICLLLALFAFQILSVNYAGLALVALGVGMIIAEFFFPTFGSLGLGGLIAFVVGSLILFDTDVPGMNVALPLIAAIATVGGLVIVGIAYIAARSMRRPVVTGVQGMIGDDAEVLQDFTGAGSGRVRYRGELWNARSNVGLQAGQIARIVKVEGLTLWVEPGGPAAKRSESLMPFTLIVVVFIVLLLFSSIKVLNEYERGVMLSLGRFTGIKGPGVIVVVPFLQQMRKVDLRVIVLNIPKQDVITRDNVSVKVNAVVYFRIVDPGKAVLQVANPLDATSQVAQTTLRSVLGQHEMDDLLSQRDKLNGDIAVILDQATEAWGIKVANVEMKDVDLDETMVRAMAKQAEAERTRRAKIIHAEGESQAAQMLVQAAESLARQPSAMQLRYLQTLADISHEKTQIIVFPLPLDLIKPLLGSRGE